jgi:ankyrin repeat protein
MGHASIVTALLKNAADPNSPIDSHESALIAATAGGYVEVMKTLLEHGTDPNINFVDDCLPALLVASKLWHLSPL